MNNQYKYSGFKFASKRVKSRRIYYGDLPVGGGAPISVQSMTNTKTEDVAATVNQIKDLTAVGCELVRVAVPEMSAARKIAAIKKKITIPLIADIHFDYKLALESIKQGIDGLRINPGNIGNQKRLTKVVNAAGEAGVPIRVGVNSGSIAKKILKKYGQPTAEAMVESALASIKILENANFYDIVVSLKATNIWMTIKAHQLLGSIIDYPFHIGITEAGSSLRGVIKSAVGIGSLLTHGFGDTLRVSITGDPVQEVTAGWLILECLDLRRRGPQVISCPTCGRTEIDLVELTRRVEKKLAGIKKPITVAVMGCVVNGPGEAREADLGISGGKGEGMLFKKGKMIKKVPEDQLLTSLMVEIRKL